MGLSMLGKMIKFDEEGVRRTGLVIKEKEISSGDDIESYHACAVVVVMQDTLEQLVLLVPNAKYNEASANLDFDMSYSLGGKEIEIV